MRKRPAGEINLPIVLIVEDEFFVRCELADCAREAGFVLVEAASAKQALAACHVKTAVCALITDIQLEDPTNGWDLAEAFRAVRSDMPVIYTSGNGRERLGPIRTVSPAKRRASPGPQRVIALAAAPVKSF